MQAIYTVVGGHLWWTLTDDWDLPNDGQWRSCPHVGATTFSAVAPAAVSALLLIPLQHPRLAWRIESSAFAAWL